MEEILNKVLKKIKPTKEEENDISTRVESKLTKINSGLKYAKAILGGSGIKGTWLKDAHDADIFVCFDYNKYKDKSSQLSDILEKHLKKKFKKIIRLHGSRDYFQIKEKGFTFEIVPILKINKSEQAKNITDVSPLHSKWVNKYKKLRDGMRLLKQFCRANDVYGAESHIKGFSGYVCEILAIYYGSFANVLKNASKWKDKVIIDPKGYYKKKNVLYEINKSKLLSPLIIIDPVQADRNAGAAISKEKFDLFRKKAKKFLKKPCQSFFEKKKFSIEDIKKKAKGNELILINVEAKSGKEDIIGCKLLKSLEFINKKLSDFNVVDYGWNWDKEAIFYFIVKKGKLPEMMVHDGPPVRLKEHVKIFKKKYKKTFVSGGKIKAKIKRRYTNARKLIKDIIKDKDVKDRVKKIRVI